MSSSKSSEIHRIEWEQKRSELRVYEELTKLRRQIAEADARAEAEATKAVAEAAKAKAEAEAEEAETLAKLRLEAICVEAQEKLDECSERDSYVSKRSRMFEF